MDRALSMDLGDRALKKQLTGYAIAIGVIVAVVIPTIYFWTSYREEVNHLQIVTANTASKVSGIIFENPAMWRFLGDRLTGMLEEEARKFEHSSSLSVLDLDGNVIAEVVIGDGIPTISTATDIGDEISPVGRIRVAIDITETWIGTGLSAALGLGLGVSIFLVLQIFPMQALIKATKEREKAYNEVNKLNELLEQRVEERTAELRAAQDTLVRQERLAVLGKLSATVSHELRNPLGTIRTSIITIADNTVGHGLDVEGAIARIERNIKRCDGIIGELLDYTRNTAPNREPTDVDDWLGGVLDEQDVPPGLSVGRDLASGVEATFDRERLRRAVINIFDNACHAAQDNGNDTEKEVVIATKIKGERVVIQVTDSGPGIPDDELGRIFEPLYSTKSFGVGLGLPVVQKIAEEHGGGVDITSTIGRGTQATLWLPLVASEQGGNETG